MLLIMFKSHETDYNLITTCQTEGSSKILIDFMGC